MGQRPSCFEAYAGESVMAHACRHARHTNGARRRADPFWPKEPTVHNCHRGRPRRRSTVVVRRAPCYFPVIYRAGLCCTRRGCGPRGAIQGRALILMLQDLRKKNLRSLAVGLAEEVGGGGVLD